MSGGAQICLVEDDPFIGESLSDRLQLEGFEVTWYTSAGTALEALRQRAFALVISDIRLGDESGEELFFTVKAENRVPPPFLFITAFGSIDRAVMLLKLGAVDYITKPFDVDDLIVKIQALTTGSPPAGTGDWTPQLGVSAAMRRIESTLPLLAARNASVLLTGESGVGKEHVARLLHRLMPGERARPFVAVNCAALSESLLEAELFGYEKGAFTGANRTKPGLFEQADGGTLFLDEIGEMPAAMQAKLLRVLQEHQVVRVGGERRIEVEVRIVCATNRDLKAEVAAGRFREDLFYRVNMIHVEIPPLRKRRDDIPWFAQRFLDDYLAAHPDEQPKRIDHSAIQALLDHTWPGNVRELRHCIERACILNPQETLTGPVLFATDTGATDAPLPAGSEHLAQRLGTLEQQLIHDALLKHHWHIIETAKALGISRKNLWEKMKKYDLHPPGAGGG